MWTRWGSGSDGAAEGAAGARRPTSEPREVMSSAAVALPGGCPFFAAAAPACRCCPWTKKRPLCCLLSVPSCGDCEGCAEACGSEAEAASATGGAAASGDGAA